MMLKRYIQKLLKENLPYILPKLFAFICYLRKLRAQNHGGSNLTLTWTLQTGILPLALQKDTL